MQRLRCNERPTHYIIKQSLLLHRCKAEHDHGVHHAMLAAAHATWNGCRSNNTAMPNLSQNFTL
jgi:hypothetical protein